MHVVHPAIALMAVTMSASAQSPKDIVIAKPCTLIACFMPNAGVALRLPDGSEPKFDVTVRIEGRTIRCALPNDGLDHSEIKPTCGDLIRVSSDSAMDCTGPFHCVARAGREEYIGIWSAPEYFTVSLSLAGKKIAEKEFSPEYTVNYPNGKGCPDECNNWRTVWTVLQTGP
jgi:hypothetical protein